MDYIIREMRSEEYCLLSDFLYEAIYIPDGIEPPPKSVIDCPELQEYIIEFGNRKHDKALVAEIQGNIVGAIWVRIMNDYGHIDNDTPSLAMSVCPQYRGLGIGTSLLKQLLQVERLAGYSKISLSVQKSNYAVKMYEKVGFTVVDENNEQTVLVGCDVPAPFEHKVIERIGTAIGQVDAIVQNRRQLSETAETAFEDGITANMCDAFLKMRPVSDADKVTTTIRYASSLTNRTGQVKRIEMRANHFLVIDELAKIYRDKVAIQDVNLTGIIRSLSKRTESDSDLKTIRLYTTFNGSPRTVTISLSDAQYRIACARACTRPLLCSKRASWASAPSAGAICPTTS